MKRICLFTALLLVLTVCLLCGCGRDDTVPEGMKYASDPARDGFSLFVPDYWTVTQNGIVCGAYVSNLDESNVTAVFTPSDAPDAASFFEESTGRLEKLFSDFRQEVAGETVTAGTEKNAKSGYSFVYSGVREETTYRINQILVPLTLSGEEGYFVLTYTASAETNRTDSTDYEDNYADFEKIVQNVVFGEQTSAPAPSEPVVDKHTPAGMQLASNSKATEYRLYVPLSWTVDMHSGFTSAYTGTDYPVSVNAAVYYPEEITSTAEYWIRYKVTPMAQYFDQLQILTDSGTITPEAATEQYEQSGDVTGSWTRLQVGGCDAFRYEFLAVLGDTWYRISHVYVINQSFFDRGLYCLTFTCSADSADAANAAMEAHAEEFTDILDTFTFD